MQTEALAAALRPPVPNPRPLPNHATETNMPRNKRIYIRDEHQAALQEFTDGGGNASELFAQALTQYIEQKRQREMAQSGAKYERIVVEHWPDDEHCIKKAFSGRPLSCELKGEFDGDWYIYETKKGGIAAVWDDRYGQTKEFLTFETVADFKQTRDVPEEVISDALTTLGDDYVVELDI